MTMSTGGPGRENFDSDDDPREFADRAGDVIGRTLEAVSERARDAADFLEERTGAVSAVRRNPLAAVGLAFAAGIAIAAISRPADRGSALERARRQLRAAALSGLTALAVRELRALAGDGELAEFVQSLLDGRGGYKPVTDDETDFGDEDEEDFLDA